MEKEKSQQAQNEIAYLHSTYKALWPKPLWLRKLMYFVNHFRFVTEKSSRKRRMELEKILSLIYNN